MHFDKKCDYQKYTSITKDIQINIWIVKLFSEFLHSNMRIVYQFETWPFTDCIKSYFVFKLFQIWMASNIKKVRFINSDIWSMYKFCIIQNIILILISQNNTKKNLKSSFHWLNVTWVEGKIWFCEMDFEIYGILLSLSWILAHVESAKIYV